jgi:hypothetical protein
MSAELALNDLSPHCPNLVAIGGLAAAGSAIVIAGRQADKNLKTAEAIEVLNHSVRSTI